MTPLPIDRDVVDEKLQRSASSPSVRVRGGWGPGVAAISLGLVLGHGVATHRTRTATTGEA